MALFRELQSSCATVQGGVAPRPFNLLLKEQMKSVLKQKYVFIEYLVNLYCMEGSSLKKNIAHKTSKVLWSVLFSLSKDKKLSKTKNPVPLK